MEIINGKAKELFLEYYWQTKIKTFPISICKREDIESFFKTLVDIFQYALIIEWLDSVGITVDVMPILDEKVKFQPNTFWLEKEIITEEIEYFESRQEATTEAIKKAVELINKKEIYGS